GEGQLMTARARVPASSSNLGSGFDCIGVAIDRWLVASVTCAAETRGGGGGITVRRHGRLTAVSVPAEAERLARDTRAQCAPLNVAADIELLIAVPPFPSDTKAARALLPKMLPHADAVLAASRAAALVQGLATGDGALLSAALDDVLHVPFRRARIPGYDAVVAAAQNAGAFGATLSGAGSAILAIAPGQQSAAVGAAMIAAWRDNGVEAEVITCTSNV